MFGKNIRTATVDGAVLEAEDAARRKREVDDLVAANRRRQAAYDADRNAAEQRRRQAAADEGQALLESRDRLSRAQQNAQTVWAARRAELRSNVIELQSALSGVEGRMHSSDMDEAVRGAAEADVFRMRLSEAELAYAQHLKTSPL